MAGGRGGAGDGARWRCWGRRRFWRRGLGRRRGFPRLLLLLVLLLWDLEGELDPCLDLLPDIHWAKGSPASIDGVPGLHDVCGAGGAAQQLIRAAQQVVRGVDLHAAGRAGALALVLILLQGPGTVLQARQGVAVRGEQQLTQLDSRESLGELLLVLLPRLPHGGSLGCHSVHHGGEPPCHQGVGGAWLPEAFLAAAGGRGAPVGLVAGVAGPADVGPHGVCRAGEAGEEDVFKTGDRAGVGSRVQGSSSWDLVRVSIRAANNLASQSLNYTFIEIGK